MTQKERLYDIFSDIKCPAWFINEAQKEKTVDYLLANGVIVLPANKGEILKHKGKDFRLDHWNILASCFTDDHKMTLLDVEEVEQELAERKDNE